LEPLSITCDTCGARLKVRDPAAIGQILMCPKCQSMVLVEAPAGWPTDANAKHQIPNVALARERGDRTAADAHDKPSSLEDDAMDEQFGQAAEQSTTDAAEVLPSLAMPGTESVWTKFIPASMSRWGLLCGGSFAAVLIGVMAWTSLSGDEDGDHPAVAVEQEVTDKAESESSAESTDTLKQRDEPKPAAKPQPEPEAENNPFAKQPKEKTKDKSSATKTPPREKKPFDNSPSEKPRPQKDPIDRVIQQPETEPKDDKPAPPEGGKSSQDLLQGMDLLDEGELFGIDSGFGLPSEAEAADPKQPNGGDEEKAPEFAPLDDPESPKLAEINVDAALKLELVAAKYDRIRLIDFLETMSDLSRVPITLDLDALAPLQVGASTRVSVESGNTTVDKLIEDVLAASHKKLGVVRGKHGLTISPTASDRPLAMDHAVGDLAEDPAARADLANLIQEFVSPSTWTEAGGDSQIRVAGDKLHVEHTMQAQYQVIVLLEKLRAARKLPPHNRFYGAETFRLASRRQQAAKKLSAVIDVNHVVRVPLASVVRELEWAAGTNISVDWTALRENNVGRQTPVQLVARGKTLEEAMDELVAPLGLAWQVHDATTLRITTKKRGELQLDLEVYDLANVLAAGSAGDELVAQIRRDTDPNLWTDEGGGGRLQVDASQSCLIVSANQSTQLAVTELLARLREQNLARRAD
jgi:hypothetical protein